MLRISCSGAYLTLWTRATGGMAAGITTGLSCCCAGDRNMNYGLAVHVCNCSTNKIVYIRVYHHFVLWIGHLIGIAVYLFHAPFPWSKDRNSKWEAIYHHQMGTISAQVELGNDLRAELRDEISQKSERNSLIIPQRKVSLEARGSPWWPVLWLMGSEWGCNGNIWESIMYKLYTYNEWFI